MVNKIKILNFYRDANKAGYPNDEFNKFFSGLKHGSIKNMGGFRIRRTKDKERPAFAVIVLSQGEEIWPDGINVQSSVLTYYGDNRKKQELNQDIHVTPNAGNKLLKECYQMIALNNRDLIPPFLVFEKRKMRIDGKLTSFMQFFGLAAPGIQGKYILKCLSAFWAPLDNSFCLNYEALFSIPDTKVITIDWLDELVDGVLPTKSKSCPNSWKNWVQTGNYDTFDFKDHLSSKLHL